MQTLSLKPIISNNEIKNTVKRLASEIRKDYQGKSPILISILKGSFMFLSDIIREINMPLKIDFIRAFSYGPRDYSSGRVELVKDIETSIGGKDAVIVEDIVDTGHTVDFIIKHLKKRQPSSLKICSLLDKPSKRIVDIKIDYTGFVLEKGVGFVVGYGLDYNEEYRYLKGIYEIQTTVPSLEFKN